ncbi:MULTISPECIES: hypothetical protein [Halomonadaceae]|nr:MULTISPECIES: hypothetical protein [Halomonas]
MPEPVYISAADSYALRGWVWRRPCVSSSHPGPVVIINTATSVR